MLRFCFKGLQEKKIRAGNYTAVFNPNGWQPDHTDVMVDAIKDVFGHLNMKLVSTKDSLNDPTKQISDIETLLALKPNIIITGPIDPVSSAGTYRSAVDAGTKLVIWSNVPQGFEHGTDYVGVVTANAQGYGDWNLAATGAADAAVLAGREDIKITCNYSSTEK